MWQSIEDKEKQRQVEKLVDWELRKQLWWTAIFVTTILGLISLHISEIFRQFFLFFSPIFISLFLAANYSFFRIAYSVSVMRNHFESLPSGWMKYQLVDKAQMSKLFDFFSEKKRVGKSDKYEWHPRMSHILISVIIGWIVLLLPLIIPLIV
jgi:hypothetical protein